MKSKNFSKQMGIWLMISIMSLTGLHYYSAKKVNDLYKEKKYLELFNYTLLVQGISQEAVDISIKSMVERSIVYNQESGYITNNLVDPCCYDLWPYWQTKKRISPAFYQKSIWDNYRKKVEWNRDIKKYKEYYANGEAFTYKELYETIKNEDFRYKELYISSCYLYPLVYYTSYCAEDVHLYTHWALKKQKKGSKRYLQSAQRCSRGIQKQVKLLQKLNPLGVKEEYWAQTRVTLLKNILWIDYSLNSTFKQDKEEKGFEETVKNLIASYDKY